MKEMPLTTSLIADRPEGRRDLLIALAHHGLASARRLLIDRIAPHTDFQRLRATAYADARSVIHAAKRHSNRLETLWHDANSLAAGAVSLADLAAAEGIKDPVFQEAVTLCCHAAKAMTAVRRAWEIERERLLQAHELEHTRFAVAVAVVRGAIRGETDEAQEEGAEPAAA